MIDVRRLLREADPLKQDSEEFEAGLSPGEAQVIRREMLDALSQAPALVPLWQRPVAVGAFAMLMLAVSGLAGHRWSPDSSRAVTDRMPADGGSSGELDCRQLQFSTPGGTRIIWIFDESLRLQESMP